MPTHNHSGFIWDNATDGVFRRHGPGTIFDKIDALQAGQQLIVLCYSLGDPETFTTPDGKTNTSDAWDFVVTSDQDPGGYVADVFVNTGDDITKQLGEQGRCDLLQQRLLNF
jgi:hypothetical protein